jgi:hypothetical protein
MLFTTPTFGQNAPNGWIQSGAWTYTLLDQDGGCGGGGVGRMAGNWLAPYDITDIDSNPVAGDEVGVDFAVAESRSWTFGAIAGAPVWVTQAQLNDLAQGAQDFPTNQNGVDFNMYIDRLNALGAGASSDNIMAVAVTYVENLTDAPIYVNACTRSDDSIRIDINGVNVTLKEACRGWGGESCQEENSGWLEPGVNKVTMYVWEGGGGFGGGLRFSTPGCAGGILTDDSADVAFLGANDGTLSGVVAGDNAAPEPEAAYAPNNKIRGDAWNFLILKQGDGHPGHQPGEALIRSNWTTPFDILTDNPAAGDSWEIDFQDVNPDNHNRGPVAPFVDDAGNAMWFTAATALENGWAQMNIEDGVNYDDFAGRNGAERDHIMGIATTYVENTTDANIPVTVCTCSDDSLLVHVNQQEVAIVNRGRGWCGGAHECQEQNCAVLVPGVNQVTIQVWEGGGGWNFRLGLLDFQTGQPITDCNDLGISYLGPSDGSLESEGSAACPTFTIDGPWLNTEQWNHLLLENDRGCGPGDQSIEGNWSYPYVMADEDPTHGDEWEIDFANAQSSGWGGGRLACSPVWVTREGLLANDPAVDFPIRGDGLMDMNDWCNRIGARNDNAMWIGTTYVNNTNDVPVAVDVCSASDDSVRVDINNYIVTRVNACRGSAGGCQETRPGELAPGINKITAYVYEGGGGFNGRFRLTARNNDGFADGVETLEQAGIEFLGPGGGDLEGALLAERPDRSHGEQWEPDVAPVEPGEDGPAGINPNGWIQTDAWNLLVPVGNPHGCGGGGVGVMAESWTGQFLIGEEDPQDGDEWEIDWSQTPANGFPGQTNNPDDIAVWRTAKSIEESLGGNPCAAEGDPSAYNADLVDFQRICEATGAQNDNVMAIATTYVENLTGEDLPIQVCTSSDDSVACYVNDELRQNLSACRGSGGDCQERADAVLVPGVNKLALLVWEGGGGFNMRFAIEANGAKLNDDSPEVDFLGAVAGPPAPIAPTFDLGFAGAADQAGGCVGDTNSADIDCVATTSNNPGDEGIMSYSFGVEARGGAITAITTDGTDAGALIDGGFVQAELTTGKGNAGAVIGVVLSFASPVTLPADGGASIATVTVETANTEAGSNVALAYSNTLRGAGQPVRAIVTWQGATHNPSLGTTSYAVTSDNDRPGAPAGLAATAGDSTVSLDWDDSDAASYTVRRDGAVVGETADSSYTDDDVANGTTYSYTVSASDACGEGAESAAAEATPEDPGIGPFSRGDSNSDGAVDISDGIFTLGYLFLGSDDPGCQAAADANGDGSVNISDPTFTLVFLFGGGAAHPEPSACANSTDEGDVAQGCATPTCN